VVLIINNQCYIANLGDSRAIYSYNSGSEFFQLSRDHKPNDLKEKKRIYKAGGTIFKTNLDHISLSFGMKETDLGFKIPFRINPGRLAVSTFLII
jgi:serine/threonine protein phosphatase PrpC